MLGRDPSTPPIVGRGGIPSVEEKGTNMQGGDKVFGVFLEGRHKVARPILKKKSNSEAPHAKNSATSQGVPRGHRILQYLDSKVF